MSQHAAAHSLDSGCKLSQSPLTACPDEYAEFLIADKHLVGHKRECSVSSSGPTMADTSHDGLQQPTQTAESCHDSRPSCTCTKVCMCPHQKMEALQSGSLSTQQGLRLGCCCWQGGSALVRTPVGCWLLAGKRSWRPLPQRALVCHQTQPNLHVRKPVLVSAFMQ